MRPIEPVLMRPSDELSPFVAEYWFVEARDVGRSGTKQADGRLGLSLWRGPAAAPEVAWDGAVAGAQDVHLAAGASMLGIRFEPGGYLRLFGAAPLGALAPDVGIGRLLLHVAAVDSAAAARDRLETQLAAGLREQDLRRLSIQAAAERLRRELRGVSVAELARDVGVGVRHFERLFQRQVGFSPASYARLQRVNAARRELRTSRSALATVAHRCGFFDQAHLSREFRRCLGVTPREYRERSSRRVRPGTSP